MILWGPYKCPRPGGPNFGDALLRHCPPRFKKHAKNMTIYLQCLNRLNRKDAAVLGKQVLMFDEKKIENTRSVIKSLLCSRLLANQSINSFILKDANRVYHRATAFQRKKNSRKGIFYEIRSQELGRF